MFLVATVATMAQPAAGVDSLHADSTHAAPPLNIRDYTPEHPLVYEGSWDLWPYTFLSVDGQPDGYSVELVRLILDRLHIPYEIHLKPTNEVFNDLKEGRSDLMLGLSAGFHDEYGHYGNTSVTLFTQSVATAKGKPVEIHSLYDLASHRVIVNEGSLAHHQMMSRGWGANAIPTQDIKESLLHLSATGEGAVIWNDLSLKYIQRRYHLDNLVITPVSMPHGEYKFMSNNPKLLASMDSMYAVLNSAELITPIQNKWFYPERTHKPVPLWVWVAVGAAAILVLIIITYMLFYRLKALSIMRQNERMNRRLALILETCQVHIWTYDVEKKLFTWHNDNGLPAYTYSPDEFSKRYSPADYRRLRDTIFRLSALPKPDGGDEEEVTLRIRARDVEQGSDELRDYVIVLSVLTRGKDGKPTVIIGTKRDVTQAAADNVVPNADVEELLKLCRTITRRMNGSMNVNTEEGVGTSIHISIPSLKETALGLLCLLAATLPQKANAQSWKERFTAERPLIIAGDWDKPPYEFLNRDGVPSGSNVETMTAVFKAMDIPFRYELKDWTIALKMFERGDADIILANANRYRGKDGFAISQNIISYDRICAASLGDSATTVNCEEILEQGIVLKSGDFTASFLCDIDSAFATKMEFQSPKVALLGVKEGLYKYFVWDEVPLKWKMHELQLDGMVLNDVTVPVSDIYIIGHDRQLMNDIDDQYSRLKQSGVIQDINDRWVHPERAAGTSANTALLIIGAILLLALLFYLIGLMAKRRVKAMTRASTELNNMMYKALHMGNFDVVIYDVKHDLVTNHYGHLLPDRGVTLSQFASHIHPSERDAFMRKVERLLSGRDKKFVLDKRWQSFDDASVWLQLNGHAIAELDKEGRPAFVINVVHDVTPATVVPAAQGSDGPDPQPAAAENLTT